MDAAGRRALAGRAALSTVPLVLGWAVFGSSIVDDAHITFAVADRLAATGQLVNNAGAAVEQSSSLLHVLLLAGLHGVSGVDVATLAWWVGGAAAGALVWATWGVVVDDLGRSRPAGVVAAGVVALAPGWVRWSVGGLETTLAALVLLLALRSWWRASERGGTIGAVLACTFAAAMAALVRPEAPAVLAAVTVGLAAVALTWSTGRPVERLRDSARTVAAPVVGLVLGTGLAVSVRLAAFGQPLPQPASTKGGLAPSDGWAYVWRRLVDDPGSQIVLVGALVVVLAVLARRHRDPAAVVLGGGVVAVVAFVVLAGGDWMPGPRLLLPALAPAAALVASRVPPRTTTVGVLVGLQLLGLGLALRTDRVGVPAWYRSGHLEVASEVGGDDVPWVLRASRVAVRDLALEPVLTQVVADVRAAAGRAPRVASFQAGLLAASLAEAFGRDVELVDLARLTTRRFDACDHVLVDSVFGRVVDVRSWVEADDPPCGVEALPDVFFGLGDPADDPLVADGYVVVARVTGRLPAGGPVAGRPLPAAQFVAVRPELAPAVLGGVPVHVEVPE